MTLSPKKGISYTSIVERVGDFRCLLDLYSIVVARDASEIFDFSSVWTLSLHAPGIFVVSSMWTIVARAGNFPFFPRFGPCCALLPRAYLVLFVTFTAPTSTLSCLHSSCSLLQTRLGADAGCPKLVKEKQKIKLEEPLYFSNTQQLKTPTAGFQKPAANWFFINRCPSLYRCHNAARVCRTALCAEIRTHPLPPQPALLCVVEMQ